MDGEIKNEMIPVNLQEARMSVRRSAALGLVFAALALVFTAGAAAQDAALVAKAKTGDAAAENSLGDYYYAKGTAADYTQSAVWYRKAAEQGDAKAEYSLGISYCWHEGVPLDYAEGYYWIDLGVESGVDDTNHWRNFAASHLTAAQVAEQQARAKKWLAAHPAKSR
jgi:TPR repeat protein